MVEIGPHSVLGPMTLLAWPESAEGGGPPAAVSSLTQPHPDVPAAETEGAFVAAGRAGVRGGAPHPVRGALRRRVAPANLAARLSLPARAPLGGGAEAAPRGRGPPAARRPARVRERRGHVRDRSVPVGPRVARRPPGVRPAGGAGRALRGDGGIGRSRRGVFHLARAGGHAAPQPARLPGGGLRGRGPRRRGKVRDGRSRCCSTPPATNRDAASASSAEGRPTKSGRSTRKRGFPRPRAPARPKLRRAWTWKA